MKTLLILSSSQTNHLAIISEITGSNINEFSQNPNGFSAFIYANVANANANGNFYTDNSPNPRFAEIVESRGIEAILHCQNNQISSSISKSGEILPITMESLGQILKERENDVGFAVSTKGRDEGDNAEGQIARKGNIAESERGDFHPSSTGESDERDRRIHNARERIRALLQTKNARKPITPTLQAENKELRLSESLRDSVEGSGGDRHGRIDGEGEANRKRLERTEPRGDVSEGILTEESANISVSEPKISSPSRDDRTSAEHIATLDKGNAKATSATSPKETIEPTSLGDIGVQTNSESIQTTTRRTDQTGIIDNNNGGIKGEIFEPQHSSTTSTIGGKGGNNNAGEINNRRSQETQRQYQSQEPTFANLEIFNGFELVNTLEAPEYKGEIDFNLTKLQRLEANLAALRLVAEIARRKQNFESRGYAPDNRGYAPDKNGTNNENNIPNESNPKYFSPSCPYTQEEQNILARYSSFGGLRNTLLENQKVQDELKELVGKKHFDEIMDSSYNAYFTPSEVVEKMYAGLFKFGVPNDEEVFALEPSCGIGHFITKAPSNFRFTAVEKDPLTAQIAKLLHPKTIIYNNGFERVNFENNFDVVIGNPPYENERVDGKELIHNFFVLKSQSLLKEGGLSSFVISSGFMDSKTNTHRAKLLNDNVFLQAFRLGNDIFKSTHTEVLSDIVFFRKTTNKDEFFQQLPQEKKEQLRRYNGEFLNTILYENDQYKGLEVELNKYFAHRSDDNVLGEIAVGTNQFGKNVLKIKETNLEKITHKQEQFNFYAHTPLKENKYVALTNLDHKYIDTLKVGNVFMHNDSFYILKENYQFEKAYFTREAKNEKLDSIPSDDILEIREKNFTYKEKLTELDKKILKNVIEFRDLLNANLEAEKTLPNNEYYNKQILQQKEQLRTLRKRILNLANTEGFNKTTKTTKERHSLRDIIQLEALESYKIFACENVKVETNKKGKNTSFELMDILQKRIILPIEKTLANNAKEALQKTINECGRIDLEILQSYMPDNKNILKELIQAELLFPKIEITKEENTEAATEAAKNKAYILKSEFISGNIKEKAARIEKMIAQKIEFNQEALPKERYLEILKENFPKDIIFTDIEINFGANYIPLDIYKDFIAKNYLNESQGNELQKIKLNRLNSQYVLAINQSSINYAGKNLEINSIDKTKPIFNLEELLERTLNNKSLTISYTDPITEKRIIDDAKTQQALENAQKIKDDFANFIFTNKNHRDAIEQIYNEKINVFSRGNLPYVDYLETPFLNKNIELRAHQKNAIFKGILQQNLLLDHEVGAGKTYAGISIVMEQIRMGLVKKALILVPNNLATSWGENFLRAYPTASILVGDKVDTKKMRKEFIYQARNGAYNAIIMKHSTFENMNVLQSFETHILEKEKEALYKLIAREHQTDEYKQLNSKEKNKFEESINKKIRRLEDKLRKKAEGKKYDNEIAFEDLGFDCLMVDEAHYYKNLFITTLQENVKGLPTQDSKKCMKMFAATSYCHENGYKLYFLTGTPISNTIAEMYTMQRYLQPQILKDLKLEYFDDWAKAFTAIETKSELDSSGVNYALVNRLSRFINAPELMNLYKQNTDIVTAQDIEKITGRITPKLKGGGAINEVLPRSDKVAAFIGYEVSKGVFNKGSLIDRLLTGNRRDPKNNVLYCTGEGRKAALDYRLIDPTTEDFPNSKINKMITNVLAHYKDEKYDKNTQVIFCDLGVSKRHSQKIVVGSDAQSDIMNTSIEEIINENKLEKCVEVNDEGEVIRTYYKEFERDENGKFVYEEEIDENGKKRKEKILKKIWEAEDFQDATSKFDVYSDILKKLVRGGIPQKEIAFANDPKKDSEKEKLFERVNAGEVRIIIGSTNKLGVGVNIQKRLVAMHELDCPWKPSELEQRRGRGVRQGNSFFEEDKENFELAHYRYATERTYDARMFQINETKLKALIDFKKADSDERSFEAIDGDLMNIETMKADATGNPFIIEEANIKRLLKDETNKEKNYKQQIIFAEKNIENKTKELEKLQNNLAFLNDFANNKDFLEENYEVEVLGIKTTRRPRDKDDKEPFERTLSSITSKISQMLLHLEDYTKDENGLRKVEFLRANGIKLDFYSSVKEGTINIKGAIITENNQVYMPENLSFALNKGELIYTELEPSKLLNKIKRLHENISDLIEADTNKIATEENNLADSKRFLQENTLDNYARTPLLELIKKDKENIEHILKIKNQIEAFTGKDLTLESEKIKHLIPKYKDILDKNGKLSLEKYNDLKKHNEQSEQCNENIVSNTAANITTNAATEKAESEKAENAKNTEAPTNILEKESIQQEQTQQEPIQQKLLQQEFASQKINEAINEATNNEANKKVLSIKIAEFTNEIPLEEKLRILEENQLQIATKTHSREVFAMDSANPTNPTAPIRRI